MEVDHLGGGADAGFKLGDGHWHWFAGLEVFDILVR